MGFLYDTAEAIKTALSAEELDDCTLIGGLALYQHGSERHTTDIDIIVSCLEAVDLIYSRLAETPDFAVDRD